MRIGFGYDSHRFGADRPLILGGVTFPDEPGLLGHSDGDAVAHAVTDAILGAAAAGDIGALFPPTDDRWKDADSMELLRGAVSLLAGLNVQVVNVDVTVICERPKIRPVAEAMRESLGTVLGIGAAGVSVKGKTNETLGWEGNREGLAVHAVALVDSVPDGQGAHHTGTRSNPDSD